MGKHFFLLICLALAPTAQASDTPNTPLIGDWQLESAIPDNIQNSAPNGIRNLRLRFSTDGKATLVDPSETLSQSTTRNPYSLHDGTLTLRMGEGEGDEIHGALQMSPSHATATITFLESGMTWTLRRLADKAIETQRLPAESVHYLPPSTPETIAAYKYDGADYSKLPVAERMPGQWEVVEISGYGAGDFPPYGAPNEVWQFDGKLVKRYGRTRPGEPEYMEYEVRGPFLMLGMGEDKQPTPFVFDAWQRLVIGDPKGQHTVLKRINRDGKGKVTMPPLRIILGYPSGSGPD
jgi:hypothetical protein